MFETPVAVFIFNRPHLTQRVLDRIRQIRPTRLLIVADGPRQFRADDIEKCRQTRALFEHIDWKCERLTNYSEENLGCKKRVASGLDWVFHVCEEAIIVEDDCLPSLSFFSFCAELIERYRLNTRLMHISGDNFQQGQLRGQASYYFSRYAHVWGWASWQRAWRHYDVTMRTWPEMKRQQMLSTILDDPVERNYWTGIFDRGHAGLVDTWDYQWLYACWCQKGLSILPNVNLVTNIGSGADATHTKGEIGELEIPCYDLPALIHPSVVDRDAGADRFTFDEHYGGRQLRAEQSPRRRTRRFLGSLKRSLGFN